MLHTSDVFESYIEKQCWTKTCTLKCPGIKRDFKIQERSLWILHVLCCIWLWKCMISIKIFLSSVKYRLDKLSKVYSNDELRIVIKLLYCSTVGQGSNVAHGPHRPFTSSQELLGWSFWNMVCSICRIRRHRGLPKL